MPDEYDRLLGQLDGLPGALQTKPATVQLVSMLGATKTYIVRTVRQQDARTDEAETAAPARFTIFLECYSREESIRLALPGRIADLIGRQRDALTDLARRKAAKRASATRKARGIAPGFLKARQK